MHLATYRVQSLNINTVQQQLEGLIRVRSQATVHKKAGDVLHNNRGLALLETNGKGSCHRGIRGLLLRVERV